MLGRVWRYGLALLVGLGTMGFAAPAYAGGIGGLEIAGPRLDGPVRVTWETSSGARAINELMRARERKPRLPDTRSLGAMYTVRVESCIGPVDQVLYPFAAGGPLVYTLPGPVDYPPLPPGWRAAPDELREIIAKASHGPDPRPATQPADPVEQLKPEPASEPPKPPERPESTSAAVAGWLIPLGLIGVGGVTMFRRHRSYQHTIGDQPRTTSRR